MNNLKKIRDTENDIRSNQNILLASYIKENGFSYSNIFDNCGATILGEAMYNSIRDLVKISKDCWSMDRAEFKDWIDEAFDELGNR